MMTRLTLRSLAAHRLRLGLTALAVVLGVSFVSGTLVFKDTMTRGFDGLFTNVYDGVEVIVTAERSFAATEEDPARPIPQSVLTTIRERTPAAASVAGASEGYAAIVGKDGKVVGGQGMTNLGGDWSEGSGTDTGSGLRIVSGGPPRAPGEVVIDSVSAGKGGLRAGDQVEILTQGPTRVMRISGIFTFGSSMSGLDRFVTYVLFTPEVAQNLLVKPGHYSEIYVQARPGVSPERLRDQVAAVLPGGYEAVTGQQEVDETQAEIEQLFGLLATFLLVFAGVSVFVGSFIIFNTFSMLVAQRTRELALLRAVGASRRQVTRSVLGEAAGVGFIGSTLGLAAGGGLALGLRAVFALFGIDLPATRPVFTSATVLWSYAVGMLVTLVAAYLPARRAARIPPVAAMRDDDAGLPERALRVRVAGGAVLAAAGGAALARGLAMSGEDGASLVGLGAGLVFVAVVMLSPVISRPITWLLGWPLARAAGAVGRLSGENTRRNPRRTAATASALMIGLALVAMVSVMAESMKSSVDGAFDRDLGADYTLQATGPGGFSPEAVEAVSAAAGVSAVTPVRLGTIKLAGEKTPVMVADPAALATPINLKIDSGVATLGADELLVQRDAADEWGWSPGSTVRGEYPDGTKATFLIAGIHARNQVASSPYIMAPAGYRSHAPGAMVQLAYVEADDGVGTRRSVESALAAYPNVNLYDQQETKAQARAEIDQLLAVIIGLLVLSVLIAALGIVNTLALSVIERTREIGLLRAVGMSRRQLRRMVRYESVVIAVFGAALGLAVGAGSGWALQRAMADQGVDVLAVPFGRLALYAGAAIAIGVVAAIWPARRAARMDVLRAITTR